MLVLVLLSMFLIVVVLLLLVVAAVASLDCGPGGRCCALPHAPCEEGWLVRLSLSLQLLSHCTARSNTKRHHKGSAK